MISHSVTLITLLAGASLAVNEENGRLTEVLQCFTRCQTQLLWILTGRSVTVLLRLLLSEQLGEQKRRRTDFKKQKLVNSTQKVQHTH